MPVKRFSDDAAEGQAGARRLQRLERGAVLDALATQVAVADGLAGALQAARGFGHRLLLRVGDLVLDVGLVAHLGRHRLEADARLLDLARVGHDGEELGLRLRERLAGLDRVQVQALQVGIHGIGGAAALGDGRDHGRGTGAHVAGAEDARAAGAEGDRVGVEAAAACWPSRPPRRGRASPGPGPGRWPAARGRTR